MSPAPNPAGTGRQEGRVTEAEVWRSPSSSTWSVYQFFRGFVFHGNVNKGEGGPAKSLVFAKHERQIAAHLGVGDCYHRQHLGAHVFFDVRAGDETDAHVGSHKSFQQF